MSIQIEVFSVCTDIEPTVRLHAASAKTMQINSGYTGKQKGDKVIRLLIVFTETNPAIKNGHCRNQLLVGMDKSLYGGFSS